MDQERWAGRDERRGNARLAGGRLEHEQLGEAGLRDDGEARVGAPDVALPVRVLRDVRGCPEQSAASHISEQVEARRTLSRGRRVALWARGGRQPVQRGEGQAARDVRVHDDDVACSPRAQLRFILEEYYLARTEFLPEALGVQVVERVVAEFARGHGAGG